MNYFSNSVANKSNRKKWTMKMTYKLKMSMLKTSKVG